MSQVVKAMKTKPMINLQSVNKHFQIVGDRKYTLRELFVSWLNQGKTKSFQALKDIDMQLYPGDFVGIIGRNGSGKSTLLKLIAGIYSADEGSVIEINGSLVPFLELGVGFNQEFTGKENIYLNGTILGMQLSYLDTRIDEIVKFAELEKFINNPVKNYSSGMMVRLAFSIAIQADADIFILDEVLGVGDEAFRRKSASHVKKLAKQGKTVLFVSHELDEVKKLCNKVAWIDDGQLRFFGDTDMALKKYNEFVQERMDEQQNVMEDDADFTKVVR